MEKGKLGKDDNSVCASVHGALLSLHDINSAQSTDAHNPRGVEKGEDDQPYICIFPSTALFPS